MGDTPRAFSKYGFTKTFVLPGVLIFLIPLVSLVFFLHAERRFDAGMRESILRQVREDGRLSADQRERAVAFFTHHPVSDLIADAKFSAMLDGTTRFHYATFRWLIRLSIFSIASGVAVFVLAGVCVWLSRRSQRAQYLSLSAGWQVLRIYGALQTIIQGAMILALSFWVTALWFHVYYVKIILVAAVLAVFAAIAVIKAIFKRPDTDLSVEGVILDRAGSPRLWGELGAIGDKVGTAPPDQVIVGIDDNFFVTEMPVKVAGTTRQGRTLYMSLSLLKQMYGAEADAVLAHEMAHFSGNDTLYSKKISPLLNRYGMYLQALHENPITLPIFHFMHCFRALFELSLGEHSRDREFRADRIAAETTSSRDLAGALLRISAYSDFRGKIQQDLFGKEHVLETADISSQIERGFHEHALTFAARPDLGGLETSHPFDSHPPLGQRLDAVGIPLASQDVQALVSNEGDGRWYAMIDDAEQIEGRQWEQFEERFRAVHEQTLAYRFLPDSDEERAIVVKSFPELTIEGKKGSLVLDCDRVRYTAWPDSLAYSEITNCSLNDDTLQISYVRGGKHKASIPMKTFAVRRQEALQAINRYYGRYLNAVAYQKQKQIGAKPGTNCGSTLGSPPT
jgi:Zn-dependent protease with chaperone function